MNANAILVGQASSRAGSSVASPHRMCRPDGAGLPRRSNAKAGGIFGLGFYKEVVPTALGNLAELDILQQCGLWHLFAMLFAISTGHSWMFSQKYNDIWKRRHFL